MQAPFDLDALLRLAAEQPLAPALGGALLLLALVGLGVRAARRRRAAPAAPAELPAPAAARPDAQAAPEREPAPRVEERAGEPAAPLRVEPAPPAVEPTPLAPPRPPAPPAPQAPARLAPPAAAPPAPVRLRDRLRLTREAFVGRLGALLGGRRVDAELLDELEELLLGADLGVRTADALLATVRKEAAGADADGVRRVLREAILARLRRVQPERDAALSGKPHVVLVLGVNGSGKTTTIGKLAARHLALGRRVLLGAGDTFRAAAIEQLQTWGERVGCEVVAGTAGGDPAAVAFDTVKAAVARGADVAIVDTAGRLQTQRPLMEELAKIARVLGRELPDAPHEVLLVLDANTGQNALSQAKLFTQAARVTGLVLTKLDGTAKGGVIVGLAEEFGIPVRYVGVGESAADLREFDAEEFVDALFAANESAP